MTTANPYMVPGLIPDGVTVNPTQLQLGDGTQGVMSFDRQGAQLTNTLRGKYGTYAHRHGVFAASAGTAAIAIAVNTTTSGAVFTLINPATSGVNVELIKLKLDFLHTNAAPATANVIGWSVVNNNTNAASGITKIADPVAAGGHSVDFSGVAPQAYVASVVTFASALTVAANFERGLFSFPASWVPTVGGYPVPLMYDHDGTMIIPPGWSCALLASTAWGSTTVVPHLTWAEYKV